MEFITQLLILKIYTVGFTVAFLIQTVSQKKFGRESAWGINRGWQSEIAIWNVFAIIVLAALIDKKFESDLVVSALFIMSLGFGLNHFLAAKNGKNRKSNIFGAIANVLGLLVIALWFLSSRR